MSVNARRGVLLLRAVKVERSAMHADDRWLPDRTGTRRAVFVVLGPILSGGGPLIWLSSALVAPSRAERPCSARLLEGVRQRELCRSVTIGSICTQGGVAGERTSGCGEAFYGRVR